MHNVKTLILNTDFSPLSQISWKKAFVLNMRNSVITLKHYEQPVYDSTGKAWPVPCVILLKKYVKRTSRVLLTKRNLFIRDQYICQYCHMHKSVSELSMDHIIPKSKGGRTEWANVVTACKSCNSRKGNKLISHSLNPYEPSHYELFKSANFPIEWQDYVQTSKKRKETTRILS